MLRACASVKHTMGKTCVLAAWMMRRVQLLQARARYMRVNLRSGKVAVPEQHLDDA